MQCIIRTLNNLLKTAASSSSRFPMDPGVNSGIQGREPCFGGWQNTPKATVQSRVPSNNRSWQSHQQPPPLGFPVLITDLVHPNSRSFQQGMPPCFKKVNIANIPWEMPPWECSSCWWGSGGRVWKEQDEAALQHIINGIFKALR